MKRLLLKRWLAVPLAVWLCVVLVAGGALAYGALTQEKTVTIPEPLTYTEVAAPATTLYPGESTTWKFDIDNAAGNTVTYDVKSIVTPSGVTVTMSGTSAIDAGSPTAYDFATGAALSLAPGSVIHYVLDVSSAKDSAPGTLTLTLTVDRS